MKKNEVFHTEESHNLKRPRRHGAITHTQNHAKLRPRMTQLNNEIHETFSLFIYNNIQYTFILFNYCMLFFIFLFKMNAKNKNLVLNFEIKKEPDFKNPFLYYYSGCCKNLIEKINHICRICYKVLNEDIVFPDSCSYYFCFACLSKWNTYNSTFPLYRKPFITYK